MFADHKPQHALTVYYHKNNVTIVAPAMDSLCFKSAGYYSMDGFVVLRETGAILNTLMTKATLAFI